MIAQLRGEITELLTNSVVLDVQGVGYQVFVNFGDDDFKPSTQARLYVYEQITEKSHDLYGFISNNAKMFFEKLLSVNGVGPKMAMAIMDLGSHQLISNAIASGNTAYITGASGVGQRVAERIVVDLKGKLVFDSSNGQAMDANFLEGNDEAIEALISLGYQKSEIIRALAKVEAKTTEDRVRLALRELSK